jgi:hypothetical protein
MYDRMVREHGYSIRKLADKLGKDKGYLENRLRLADAPVEVRELVSLRKDTLSHAYELMKVDDPKKRRRLAEQVARGELTLIKLREKIDGRRPAKAVVDADDIDIVIVTAEVDDDAPSPTATVQVAPDDETDAWVAGGARAELTEDSLVNAKQHVAEAVEELVEVLRSSDVRQTIPSTDRANLAKYLTITKLKLENAIAMVRSDD